MKTKTFIYQEGVTQDLAKIEFGKNSLQKMAIVFSDLTGKVPTIDQVKEIFTKRDRFAPGLELAAELVVGLKSVPVTFDEEKRRKFCSNIKGISTFNPPSRYRDLYSLEGITVMLPSKRELRKTVEPFNKIVLDSYWTKQLQFAEEYCSLINRIPDGFSFVGKTYGLPVICSWEGEPENKRMVINYDSLAAVSGLKRNNIET